MKPSPKFYFLVLLAVSAFSWQEARAQDFSAALSESVPQIGQKLNSNDAKQRISVLLAIVVEDKTADYPRLKLSFNLDRSDYALVIEKILEKDLLPIEDKLLSETLWKIGFIVKRFELKEFAGPLAEYLTKTEKGGIRLGIIEILRVLKATECDARISAMLQASSENVRYEALRTLIEIRSKKAVPVLLEQLKEKQNWYFAVENLVKLDAKEAAPEIAKLLKADNFDMKAAALKALVSLNAREQALEIWNLASDEKLKTFVVAALIFFGDDKAIQWFGQQIAVDREFTTSVLAHAGSINAKPIVPTLVSILERGKVSDDAYTDNAIRRSIVDCLGRIQSKEAIPVLRKYVRNEVSFRKWDAIRVLGELEASEAVEDLIFVLNRALNGYTDKGYGTYGDDYHTINYAGLALARIGDRKAWPVLIDAAAHPKFDYGDEVVGGLNRYLDPELWEKAKTRKVSGGVYKSIKYAAEQTSRESGIPIIIEFDGPNGEPAIMTGEEMTVFNLVNQMQVAIKNRPAPEKYTYVFEDGTIRVLPLKKAVQWWKDNILTK